MMSIVQRLFNLKERQTTLFQEGVAGSATFLTMFYILIVNPPLMVRAGMPPQVAHWGTCLGAAFGCLCMGLGANAPFAMAPGLGLNAYFALTLVPQIQKRLEDKGLEAAHQAWQIALALVVISGAFLGLLNLLRVRETLLKAIPLPLRSATCAGIGVLICVVGLQNVGWLEPHGDTGWVMGPLTTGPSGAVALGLVVALAGLVRGRPMGLFWSLGATALGAALWGFPRVGGGQGAHLGPDFMGWESVLAVFPVDMAGAWAMGGWDLLASLVLVGLMDSVGTTGALMERMGKPVGTGAPRVSRVFMADAVGIQGGGLLGCSPLTIYVESATGLLLGGRTGLTACVVGLFFLSALFFMDAVALFPPYLASPVLICVGASLFTEILKLEPRNLYHTLPACLCLVGVGLTLSVSTGLCWGFGASVVLKCAGGRWREVGWVEVALGALLFFGNLP